MSERPDDGGRSASPRFAADPEQCTRQWGGHLWHYDQVVIDTWPEMHTQYCERCPTYREMLVGDGYPREWSEPRLHLRFRRER